MYAFLCLIGPPQKKAFDDFKEYKSVLSENLYLLAQSRHANVINFEIFVKY